MNTLEAVNIMLSHISQSPVSTLSGNKTSRVIMAENLLQSQSKAVQMLSYDFNKIETPLFPDENGEIILPVNTLKVTVLPRLTDDNRYVQRGNRLYDKTRNTYKINKSLDAEIVKELDFEELPEPVKWYVLMNACNKFVAQVKDDRNKIAYTQQEVLEAKQVLDEYEAECGNYNILNVYNDKRYL